MVDVVKFLMSHYRSIGMTKERFSKLTGFNQMNIYRWERGINSPSIYNTQVLANVLGFDIVLIAKKPPEEYRKWLK